MEPERGFGGPSGAKMVRGALRATVGREVFVFWPIPEVNTGCACQDGIQGRNKNWGRELLGA